MPTNQQLCDSFYNMSNIVTIKVTMPAADWTALRTQVPHGGNCNFGYIGDRYDWFTATSVEISGSNFPAGGPYTLNTVGISKKSYCGSFSNTKPCLKIDFSKYVAGNEAVIENLIGTHYMTLNNCIQDASYIRQALGYEMFRQAGLPHARNNFAHVYVNNTYYGVYVNIEPMKKRFIQNNFNGNDNGNLYEFEVGEDFTPAMVSSGRISYEGFSGITNMADISLASNQLAVSGINAMDGVINKVQFIKHFAMECLLKHWDGYTNNTNNTYVYNDVTAVVSPTAANVDFKFIAWGLDQILQEGAKFKMNSSSSKLGNLVVNDPDSLARLKTEIRTFCNTIFDRENQDASITPFINQMQSVLTTMGLNVTAEIDKVRKQVKLVKSGGYQLIGEFPLDSVFLLDKVTGNCIHASNLEFVGTTPPNVHQEVYHYAPTTSKADRWNVRSSSTAGTYRFTNRAYSRYLHASGTYYTLGGHLNVYNFVYHPHIGNDWYAEPVDWVSASEVSGYFRLKSARTNNYVNLSQTDLTPLGRKQVCQVSNVAEATTLYVY